LSELPAPGWVRSRPRWVRSSNFKKSFRFPTKPARTNPRPSRRRSASLFDLGLKTNITRPVTHLRTRVPDRVRSAQPPATHEPPSKGRGRPASAVSPSPSPLPLRPIPSPSRMPTGTPTGHYETTRAEIPILFLECKEVILRLWQNHPSLASNALI